jgi:hypothetical protein
LGAFLLLSISNNATKNVLRNDFFANIHFHFSCVDT